MNTETIDNPLRITRWLGALSFFLVAQNISAHSEPDKARYVAENGADKGFCDAPLRPCATIGYAVQQAKKGDSVLVASGKYEVSTTEEIFYLKSDVVPVLAGFNRFDHYQVQSPEVNETWLAGVPVNLADTLREKGFKIITDGKSQMDGEKLQKLLSANSALNEKQVDVACVNGLAGSFSCENVDLVAHVPLNQFSSRPSSGSDIWGHVDLNDGNEYAIMGVRNGVAVFDLSNPENPLEVGTLTGSSTTWRDIKVYQYYDESRFEWRAYAYATVDGASDGVTIIDLNNLPTSISLVERNMSVGSAHNVYISNVDHTLNVALDGTEAKLQITGANPAGGSFHSYSLSNPETITVESNQTGFEGYTHDGASVLISDSRKDTGCVNGTSSHCSVFVDFNEKEMVLWDITETTNTQRLGTGTYNDVSQANQYIHSGWVTEDKQHVLLHDEFDEQRGGLNSTVRIFNINNLNSPTQVGQWTGPTRAIDHNGFVRGNRYYLSNYERGLTILDITNPSDPQVAGYFDTFPSNDSAQFNGAWGVYPFLPSGLLLVSDINGGLFVLRDKTLAHDNGTLHFAQSEITTERGVNLAVNVSRTAIAANAETVSVGYEFFSGTTEGSQDYTASSGVLEWIADDSSDKSISITIAADPNNEQPKEVMYVRLFNPTNGATLSQPSYVKVTLNGQVQSGAIGFTSTAENILEGDTELTFTVERVGGVEGPASIDFQTVSGTALAGEDFEATSGTLNWADGDSGGKTVNVTILSDDIEESDETFTLQLSNETGASLGPDSSAIGTILDDDSNEAPTVNPPIDFEVNGGQFVTLTATATDPEGDALSYAWEQRSGTTVLLQNSDQASASFNAPRENAELSFRVTVTDERGAASNGIVNVTVVMPKDSGGALILLLPLLLLRKRLKKLSSW